MIYISGVLIALPGAKTGGCNLSITSEEEAEKQIELLEKWSAEHPKKTRQDVFLEQWPCAKVDDTGILCIYPCDLDTSEASGKNCDGLSCSDCRREFWMKEME